ncbi:MAG: hypothetical protein JKY02_03780 [Flavobacteriaceae bacterium]|nr:hypothetical protein [Flavobacteriaceae bacterium]
MGLFSKVDKVLASSKNLKVMERTSADKNIEEQINNAGIQKFAESDYGDIYVRTDELGGFLILETLIVSVTNFKSKKGSKLTFYNDDESLAFESDEAKIESDFSGVSNRYVTKIDYNIEAEQIAILEEKRHTNARFEINGKEIIFSTIK